MLDYKRLKKSFDVVMNNDKYALNCRPVVVVLGSTLETQYQYREIYYLMSEDDDIKILSNNVTHTSLTFMYKDRMMELKFQSKDRFTTTRSQKYGYVFISSEAKDIEMLAKAYTMSPEYDKDYYIKNVVEIF